MSHLQGGSFIQGAAGGLIGKYVGGQAYENNTGAWHVLQNTMIVAGSAYLSAKVTWGKPGTAMTAAVMVYLFNEEGAGAEKRVRNVHFIRKDQTNDELYNYDVYITDETGEYVAGPFSGSESTDSNYPVCKVEGGVHQ